MTTLKANRMELNKMELEMVNGGSFWDSVTDFINIFIPGKNNAGKKIVEELTKPDPNPSPRDIPNIPPWEM